MADLISTKEPSIASYSFNDIARGNSLVTFYAGKWENADMVSGMVLSNSTFYSSEIWRKFRVQSTSTSRIISDDINLTFGGARIINGDVIINYDLIMGDKTAGAGANVGILSGMITLKKVSGSTVEILGNASSQVLQFETDDANLKSGYVSNRITVSNKTFKKDDMLRLTLDIYGKGLAGSFAGAIDMGYGADPVNRSIPSSEFGGNLDTSIETIFIVQVPFKIDV